ncbi:hypothetical protein HDK77DRAFT_76327 [Phyllosticta capitalensis]
MASPAVCFLTCWLASDGALDPDQIFVAPVKAGASGQIGGRFLQRGVSALLNGLATGPPCRCRGIQVPFRPARRTLCKSLEEGGRNQNVVLLIVGDAELCDEPISFSFFVLVWPKHHSSSAL